MGSSLVDAQATPTHHRCQGARAQPGDGEDEDHQMNIDRGKYEWWEMGAYQRSFEGKHMEPVTGEALTCNLVFPLSPPKTVRIYRNFAYVQVGEFQIIITGLSSLRIATSFRGSDSRNPESRSR